MNQKKQDEHKKNTKTSELNMTASFHTIESLQDLDMLFARSFTEPVVLFKHSNSCGTSAYVFEIMHEVPGDIHLVTVQERRDISNAIADRTGVRHQTPQAFVIAGGEIAYSASHYNISPEAISNTVSKLSTGN